MTITSSASLVCRSISLLAIALLIVPTADAAVDPQVSKFFQTYCVDCHGPAKPKGDFRVDALKIAANAADAENWQLVLDNLQLGEMPPKDARQPTPAEVEKVTAWIQSEISRAASVLKGTGGEVVLRRINRVEYANTIADLFDVHGDFTAGFPEDLREHGFDNNGDAHALVGADAGIHEGGRLHLGSRHRACHSTRDEEQDIHSARRE